MLHTPIDFLLSAGLIGSAMAASMQAPATALVDIGDRFGLQLQHTPLLADARPAAFLAVAWVTNQAVRLFRLRASANFEARALLQPPTRRRPLVDRRPLLACRARHHRSSSARHCRCWGSSPRSPPFCSAATFSSSPSCPCPWRSPSSSSGPSTEPTHETSPLRRHYCR